MALLKKAKNADTTTETIAADENAQTKDKAESRPDLSKLKKKDLLEILVAQGEEIDALRAQVISLEAQLANREFQMKNVGSIAQASLQVTDIFKEAEKAAKIYLDEIRRRYV